MRRVSLNRSEQRVYDYLQAQAEERHFWMGKVQTIARSESDDFAAAGRLEMALWSYYRERAEHVPVFRDAARHEGLQRTSMRNLAELLLRLWTTPRAKPKKPTSNEE